MDRRLPRHPNAERPGFIDQYLPPIHSGVNPPSNDRSSRTCSARPTPPRRPGDFFAHCVPAVSLVAMPPGRSVVRSGRCRRVMGGSHWEVPKKGVLAVTARYYEIRVRGHIRPDELIEFENVTAVAQFSETVLRGLVIDQAALQGMLRRLHVLGLDLIEVRRVRRCPDSSPAHPDPTHRMQ